MRSDFSSKNNNKTRGCASKLHIVHCPFLVGVWLWGRTSHTEYINWSKGFYLSWIDSTLKTRANNISWGLLVVLYRGGFSAANERHCTQKCDLMELDGRRRGNRDSWYFSSSDVYSTGDVCMCVCCVFFPSILDIKFVGRTSRGHTGGRSHRIFNPPSFCGACLDFCREKDSAIPFPRRPWSRILCTNELIVLHPLGIFILVFSF